jgi:hypothetical protein
VKVCKKKRKKKTLFGAMCFTEMVISHNKVLVLKSNVVCTIRKKSNTDDQKLCRRPFIGVVGNRTTCLRRDENHRHKKAIDIDAAMPTAAIGTSML